MGAYEADHAQDRRISGASEQLGASADDGGAAAAAATAAAAGEQPAWKPFGYGAVFPSFSPRSSGAGDTNFDWTMAEEKILRVSGHSVQQGAAQQTCVGARVQDAACKQPTQTECALPQHSALASCSHLPLRATQQDVAAWLSPADLRRARLVCKAWCGALATLVTRATTPPEETVSQWRCQLEALVHAFPCLHELTVGSRVSSMAAQQLGVLAGAQQLRVLNLPHAQALQDRSLLVSMSTHPACATQQPPDACARLDTHTRNVLPHARCACRRCSRWHPACGSCACTERPASASARCCCSVSWPA
jgi:hypothetical protein